MGNSLTVLLVEDNEDEAALLTKVLCRSGATSSIRVVQNGEEAIRYLQGEDEYMNRVLFPIPNIIFTDLKMSGLGGLGVLKWLKSHPSFFVIPIIVFTGSTDEKDIQNAYSFGANAYMIKPGHYDDLQESIANALAYWSGCQTPKPIVV